MQKKYYTLILLLCICISACSQQKIRLACVGNSITQGVGSSDPNKTSYVAVLSAKLGDEYNVKNCGLSGATLCKNTHKPYDQTTQFADAKAFNPDVVTIALGTNDSQPKVWYTGNFAQNFEKDLIDICDQFENLTSKPKIYLCLPIPIIQSDRWQHQPDVLKNEIIPIIRKVAQDRNYPIIDLYTPFVGHKEYYPSNDMLHPSDAGHQQIAETIYEALTENKVQ